MPAPLQTHVIQILDEALSLGGRGLAFKRETQLFGALPEFDSMAVVTVISSLEERLGIELPMDEMSAAVFESVGSLVDFLAARLPR
jgi:acyl carrier protein